MNLPSPHISFIDVTKTFSGEGDTPVRALDDVTMDVGRNEFFTLLGPSGCGKTTLLRALAGFEEAERGRILIEGEDVSDKPPHLRPVNTVFQSYALFPHMSVSRNVGFALRMLDWSRGEIEARVGAMLDLVKLRELAGRSPMQLSGGQQQRVALARALAPRPKVLLLDEPLSALDLKLRKEMQVEMKRIQQESETTFLFVTHDQEEALTMSDRVAVMDRGRLQQIGTPLEIYYRPANRFVADFIGEMNFLTARPMDGGEGAQQVFECGGGRLRLAVDRGKQAIPRDAEVTLAIRPELCRFTTRDSGASSANAENVVHGVVENLVFAGPHVTATIDLGLGLSLSLRKQADADSADTYAPGTPVAVVLPPERIVVLGS